MTDFAPHGIFGDLRASVPRTDPWRWTKSRRMNFSQAYSTTGHSGLHRVLLIVFGIAVVIRLLNLATLPTDPATLLQEDA